MTNKTISALPEAVSVGPGDLLEIEQAGISKRVTKATLLSSLLPGGLPDVTGINGRLVDVEGLIAALQSIYGTTLTAQEYAQAAELARAAAVYAKGQAETITQSAIAARDGAVNAAEEAIDQIAFIGDDNLISRLEKIAVLIPQNARLQEAYTRLDAMAGAYEIVDERQDATDAWNAWVAYRDSLDPAWDDVTQHTPVNRVTLRQLLADVEHSLEALDAKIQQYRIQELAAAADGDAPDKVGTVTVTSSWVLDTDGSQIVRMTISWPASAAADINHYRVAITLSADTTFANAVEYQAGTNKFELTVPAATAYRIRVGAADHSGNVGEWSDPVTHTTASDDVPPAAPTDLEAVAGFKSVWLEWTNPADGDLSLVEIWEHTANNSAGASKIATVNAQPNAQGRFVRSGLGSQQLRWYWVKAVDTSGNVSDFSDGDSATTAKAGTVDISDTAITAPLIAAEAIIGEKIKAGEIVGTHFNTATSLPGTITVGTTGVSIGTVESRAADPAARVNSFDTQINPGKILISGTTSLSDWRQGGDLTKISGGAISANTISANKVNIGLRGIDIAGLTFDPNNPGADQLSWSAGTISYVGDASAASTAAISAGSATWVTGTLYIYWVKGATELSSTVFIATAYAADHIVLATYRGGMNLAATYGRTIIDGSTIKTGTITADRIKGGETFTQDLYVGGTRFALRGAFVGSGKGALVVTSGDNQTGIKLVELGWLEPSKIGFRLRNPSGSLILDSDFLPIQSGATRNITLKASATAFTFLNRALAPSGQVITLEAVLPAGASETVLWETTPTVTLGTTANANERTLAAVNFGSHEQVAVRAYIEDGSGNLVAEAHKIIIRKDEVSQQYYDTIAYSRSNALDANGALLDAASGGVLTRQEKRMRIEPEIARIQAAYSRFQSLATSMGYSGAAKTDHTTRYNQLLNNYLAPFNLSTNPNGTSIRNLSVATAIDLPTFTSYFGNYYDAEEALVGALNQLAGTTATWSATSGRPAELTDGRVASGLDSSGNIARSIPTAIKTSSNILSRSGGGTFTGDVDAERNNRLTIGSDTAGTSGRARMRLLNNGGSLVDLQLPETVQNRGVVLNTDGTLFDSGGSVNLGSVTYGGLGGRALGLKDVADYSADITGTGKPELYATYTTTTRGSYKPGSIVRLIDNGTASYKNLYGTDYWSGIINLSWNIASRDDHGGSSGRNVIMVGLGTSSQEATEAHARLEIYGDNEIRFHVGGAQVYSGSVSSAAQNFRIKRTSGSIVLFINGVQAYSGGDPLYATALRMTVRCRTSCILYEIEYSDSNSVDTRLPIRWSDPTLGGTGESVFTNPEQAIHHDDVSGATYSYKARGWRLGGDTTATREAATIANQSAFATASNLMAGNATDGTNLSNSVSKTSRFGTNGRMSDGRALTSNKNFGIRSLLNEPTLSSSDAGTTATINLGASSYVTDWGSTINLPSASFTGKAFNTKNYIWRNQADPETAGASYGSSTSLSDALGTGKSYIAYVTTVSAGGSGGGGGIIGGIDCVEANSWVEMSDGSFKRARDVQIGEHILALDYETMDSTCIVEVGSNRVTRSETVLLVTESGIELILSAWTPITTRNGNDIAANAWKYDLPVKDENGFRWERCTHVEYVGERDLARISCGGATFAAGAALGRSIFTHNPSKP